MSGQTYAVTVRATGEVRDAAGNLISSEPIEATTVITQQQYDDLISDLTKEQS